MSVSEDSDVAVKSWIHHAKWFGGVFFSRPQNVRVKNARNQTVDQAGQFKLCFVWQILITVVVAEMFRLANMAIFPPKEKLAGRFCGCPSACELTFCPSAEHNAKSSTAKLRDAHAPRGSCKKRQCPRFFSLERCRAPAVVRADHAVRGLMRRAARRSERGGSGALLLLLLLRQTSLAAHARVAS